MEIVIDSFVIFSCLMFWIVFHNKKGLLSEIRKTEKKISEKIIVLEDLLDKSKLSLFNQSANSEMEIMIAPDWSPQLTDELILIPGINNKFSTEFNVELNTEYRVLDLPQDLIRPDASDNKSPEVEVIHQGVHDMIMEAKENLRKIDVSEVTTIRTFKDVVLMSKKLEHERS